MNSTSSVRLLKLLDCQYQGACNIICEESGNWPQQDELRKMVQIYLHIRQRNIRDALRLQW